MIRISISLAALEAIAATMPLWSVGYEHERTARASGQTALTIS
jgi:hypothetical protein